MRMERAKRGRVYTVCPDSNASCRDIIFNVCAMIASLAKVYACPRHVGLCH